MARPIGRITRGTTGVNRLRRVDRWIATLPVLRETSDPLVVDLGYGASDTTTVELAERLAAVRPDLEVLGIEIDPARVLEATQALRAREERDGLRRRVRFRLGGFEVPLEPPTRRAAVIRAMNVLRQYQESEVVEAWARLRERLQPAGMLVEGTCSEDGRIGAWATLDAAGPQTLTLGLRLASIGTASLATPGVVAERLPKALIHRNVPGEPIHAFLRDLDHAWAAAAPLSVYGPRQRWIAAATALGADWPILGGRSRWRLGELTVAWSAVAPRDGIG